MHLPQPTVQGQPVTAGQAIYHVDGAAGTVDSVLSDGTIIVQWRDGTRNRWDTDEHRMLLQTPLSTEEPRPWPRPTREAPATPAYDLKLAGDQAHELGFLLASAPDDGVTLITQQGDQAIIVAFTRDNGATNVATYEITAAGTVTEDDPDAGLIAEESPDPGWMNP